MKTEQTEAFVFEAGDELPDWLIEIDPLHAQSVKGKILFRQKCSVVIANGVYWVLPVTLFGSIVSGDGFVDCAMHGATKDVYFPTYTLVTAGKGDPEIDPNL